MIAEIPAGLRGIVPSVGDVWIWEPLKDPPIRERVVVTEVRWNGEEVMIGCKPTDGAGHYWNELSRWVEATVLVCPADAMSEGHE